MKRRPGSTRPLMNREAMVFRHALILRLWREPTVGHCRECGQIVARQRTRKEIAMLVGLRDGSTVGRHINEMCRCER